MALSGLWHRQDGRCAYCQRPTLLPPKRFGGGGYEPKPGALYASRDHRIPVVRGGDDTPGNVVMACQPCNGLKGDLDWPEWLAFMRQNPEWWTKELAPQDRPVHRSTARKVQAAASVQQARNQVERDINHRDRDDRP